MRIIDRAIANSVPAIPRPIVCRVSGRYMTGEHLEERVETIRDLNREGCAATVDVLGESTQSERDAVEKLEHYKQVVDALDEHALKSDLSVKLTGLGLDEELQRILVDAGHKVRVYVPFGKDWYEYSTRRLKDNSMIANYVAKDVIGSITNTVKR